MNEIDKFTDDDVKKILLVNKADKEDMIEVSEEELERFAKQHGISYIFTSAKTGKNVDQAFMKMT